MKKIRLSYCYVALAFILFSFSEVKAAIDAQIITDFVNSSTVRYKVQIKSTSGTPKLGLFMVKFTNSNTSNITSYNTSSLGSLLASADIVISTNTYASGVYTIESSAFSGTPIDGAATLSSSYQDLFTVTFNHNNSGTNDITFNTSSTYFTDENGSSISNGTLNNLSGSPLPVTLTKFNATISNHNVILNWATANEINNDKFEVERSSNGIDFVKVGEVKGNGNSNVLNNYRFVDNSIQNANENKLFYRLKQHDFNGDFEYSKITLVKLDKNINQVKVYPNPSNHMVTVEIANPELMSSKIEILGLDGKSYLTLLTERSSEDLDISELSKGVYFVRVTGADDMPSIQRLIIQ